MLQQDNAQVGYVTAWEGNCDMGSGEQEITRIIEGERIEFKFRLKKPFAQRNQGCFAACQGCPIWRRGIA